MVRLAVLVLLLPVAVAAQEDELPVKRADCEPLYTVQKRQCMVETVWQCQSATGVVFINETIASDGAVTATYYDDDHFQIAQLPLKKRINGKKGDRFSLSSLKADGSDKIQEVGMFDVLETGTPLWMNVQGEARLSGETLVIPGAEADHFQVRLLGRVGELKFSVTSQGYIDLETGTVFNGSISSGLPNRQTVIESEPVALFREGEDGFLATAGVHDCNGANG